MKPGCRRDDIPRGDWIATIPSSDDGACTPQDREYGHKVPWVHDWVGHHVRAASCDHHVAIAITPGATEVGLLCER